MSTGYHIDEPEGLYFVNLQVVNWVDVFTRQAYKDILINNLAYCQKNKGLFKRKQLCGRAFGFGCGDIAAGLGNDIAA